MRMTVSSAIIPSHVIGDKENNVGAFVGIRELSQTEPEPNHEEQETITHNFVFQSLCFRDSNTTRVLPINPASS